MSSTTLSVMSLVRMPIQVPLPRSFVWIEREQALFDQRREELNPEEWISAGLLVHQLRQGPHTLRFAVQRIGDELVDIFEFERR